MLYSIVRFLQIPFMIFLSGNCGVLFILALTTPTLSANRRRALVMIEFSSMILLLSDCLAYTFRGELYPFAYYMVRVSNFLVFAMYLYISHSFNLYLFDLMRNEGKQNRTIKRLITCELIFLIGMLVLVGNCFTPIYYYFNEYNQYIRAPLFWISFLFPLIITIIQSTVVIQYRKQLGPRIVIPLIMFTMAPEIASFFQIFLYGISLTNMTMIGMAVLLYLFEIWRINDIEQEKIAIERKNNAKSRFLANMSHEIRTPINTILGMNEMILREDPTGVPKSYFMSVVGYSLDVKAATETLLGLINDILDISKIESGKIHLVEQEYDMREVLRGIIVMIKGRSEQNNLDFNVDIDPHLPTHLYGDMGKIKQIVLNLLTNAVKYTEKGGFTLSAKPLETNNGYCTIQFSVKDSGIGVKEEDIPKLFNAFERLDEERNSSIQGTGLGLNISKQFADLMQGKLWCESVYGEGSNFIFEVKQKIMDEAEMGIFDVDNQDLTQGPYFPQFIAPNVNILVVDDNEMNLMVISSLLKSTQMNVKTVTSGEACLEELSKATYQLVLLDHMMPGLDGLETATKIRETNKDIPLIALTANYTSDGKTFYGTYGFNDYLSKPIDGRTLEKCIIQYLPEDLIQKPELNPMFATNIQSIDDLPEEYEWLKDVEGIALENAIKFSGGIDSFIFSLNLFYDTIDENCTILDQSFKNDDIKMYTIKVHSLKSSARIIGAEKLSKMAADLEDAGKKMNIQYIIDNSTALLDEYRLYKERLAPIKVKVTENKEEIDVNDLKDAIKELKTLIEAMDYDGMMMVIEQLDEYAMPAEYKFFYEDLVKAAKLFDWDKLDEIIAKVATDE